MALSSGTRLGPYEIESPLGAGGMGEVYRARDTRLDRTVAIKVLPHHLSSNLDLKQRFERGRRGPFHSQPVSRKNRMARAVTQQTIQDLRRDNSC